MNARAPPSDLRTEYDDRPMGLTCAQPRFSWRPNGRQRAYRVRVGLDPGTLDDDPLWDSGRVASEQSVGIPYDGPALQAGTRYYWQVRVWLNSEPTAWSAPSWWEMGVDEDEWEASWIRAPLPDDELETGWFRLLRTEFVLDQEIDSARLHAAACHQYAIWVNGEEVGRGQSFCYPDRQYVKTYDVTGSLRSGEPNAIAVEHAWLGWGKGRPRGEPGLLVQLEITAEAGERQVVVSDGEWRTAPGPTSVVDRRSPASREPIERIDGRRMEPGWRESGFDDADWEPVAVLGSHPTEPWERLLPQRRGIDRDIREPETVRRLDDGTIVADFGRVYAGVPIVTFSAGEAGREVVIRGGFRLDEDGHVSTSEGVQWTDMRYEYVQRDGEQTVRPFVFLGFRYLAVEGAAEDVRDGIRLCARRNAVPDEQAATFSCDDETVEAVWALARHSALYGSQEGFLDTPTREKGQFVGDALNISRTTMAAFRERALTRQALSEFARSRDRYWPDDGRVNAVYPTGEGRRDIPDYTLMYVEWVWQYYRETGDKRLLERLYPLLTDIGAYVAADIDTETGLVTQLSGGDRDVYRHGIVDWPEEMRYGYDMETVARTTVNVLAVAVFDRLASAADALDRPATEIERYRERDAGLRSGINDRLTREDGSYVDGLSADGRRSEHASQHANAMALAFGIVPEDAVGAVADHVVSAGIQMGPLTADWLLEALDVAGRHDAMVDLLTAADRDGWAKIIDAGGTFTWESWHARELPDEERFIVSESHAWGATVLGAIHRFLLGVRLAAPGGDALLISPPAGGLSQATGRVPTERGPVDLAWEREEDGSLRLSVDVPATVTAHVRLPSERPETATVLLDDEVAWAEGRTPDSTPDGIQGIVATDGAVHVTVEGGTHRIDLQ